MHLVELADDFRGQFRRSDPNRANKYANLIDDALDEIKLRDGKLAGFISETFPSVGGQIIPPDGYLIEVYKKIKNAGGICIADEVQTGLGRLGSFFYGFEQQNVLPDIVVLGKPIGNGHPIGVVVTTKKIAKKFNLKVESREVDRTELYIAQEIFYCGTGQEIMPILSVDKMLAGNGKPGEITRFLQNKFTEIVRGNNKEFNEWNYPVYQ